MATKLLNLGCGRRFHRDWTNVDFSVTGDGVLARDLTAGVPFPDGVFEVVYHSHVLEHFPAQQAQGFVDECFRVLAPHGVIRVAVPDLEQITRAYLEALEGAAIDPGSWQDNYDWVMLELLDQTVRNRSGGDMLGYLRRTPVPNEDYIVQRLGVEGRLLLELGRAQQQRTAPPQPERSAARRLRGRVGTLLKLLRDVGFRRETLIRKLLGPADVRALQAGRFRSGGEVHQWMYDRFSLARILGRAGFTGVVRRNAHESYIAGWTAFNLDTEPDGSVYKPDSLFFEARKPGADGRQIGTDGNALPPQAGQVWA